MRHFARQLVRRGKPVVATHDHVEQDHVRAGSQRQCERGFAVRNVADDFAFSGDDRLHQVAQHPMVICDQDPNPIAGRFHD